MTAMAVDGAPTELKPGDVVAWRCIGNPGQPWSCETYFERWVASEGEERYLVMTREELLECLGAAGFEDNVLLQPEL